ncbi:MAG TPA: hypothetical protein VNG51_07400 [Ktedonobacteraceae bacterium]|nr:hypothetical protein [Ktedonobacteraceae bacterium]
MKGTYKAALLLVAVVTPIPVVATFITAILYIILEQQFTSLPGWLNDGVLCIGFGVTLIIWLFVALFCRGRATAKYANKLSYDAIIQELRRLEVNYDTINTIETNDAGESVEIDEATTTVQTTKAGEISKKSEVVDIVEYIRPELPSDSAGALQRAYYALYGENEDEFIESILKVNGMQWVRATGYISIWNRLQSADAEMISLLPIETISDEADYDLSRLAASAIPDSQQWMDTIHKAKATLENINKQQQPHKPEDNSGLQGTHGHALQDDEEQKQLEQALVDLLKFSLTSPTLPMDDTTIPKSFGPAFLSIIKHAVTTPTAQQTEEQARADLRRARVFINSYVSNRWAGLIQSRNLLIGISFYTSIFIYALFMLAIIENAPPSSIFAAFVFFIVGAVAGLFPRLAPKTSVTNAPAKTTVPAQMAKTNSQLDISASQSSAAKGQSRTTNQPVRQTASSNMKPLGDDYGLSRARILITPVFSGLAALIGVVLASMLSITLVALTPGPSNTSIPTPTAIVANATVTTATTAPQGNRSIPNYPSLDEIYSLSNNVQGVIFALVFGFLPSLVINALQREAVDLQNQLQSTDPGEQVSLH